MEDSALIHCISSNCLLGVKVQRLPRVCGPLWTLAVFQAVVHITLTACGDFLLIHPRYLVKTFFLFQQGKHRVLSPRFTVYICSTGNFPLPLFGKRKKEKKKEMNWFRLNDIFF